LPWLFRRARYTIRDKPLLKSLKENLGMVPNLAAAMSESPQLLAGFLSVREIYTGGTFTPAEIQVLSLTASMTRRNAEDLAARAEGGDP
jgi:hypothetical protein